MWQMITNLPGLYIHIPFCVRKCRYCSFYSLTNYSYDTFQTYHSHLLQDIAISQDWFAQSNCIPDTLYFGGGTPSLLPLDILQSLLQACYKLCPYGLHSYTADDHTILNHSSGDHTALNRATSNHIALNHAQNLQKKITRPSNLQEITLEINPGTVNQAQLLAYRQLGIDRISIGIQSLNDKTLQWLGRIHTAQQAYQCLDQVAEYFDNFGVDIIYAIPETNFKDLQETVQKLVTQYRPPHISAYCLSIEENTALADANIQVNDEQFVTEYTWLHEYLTSIGYIHYEVSNFAQPGFMSLHNSKYWTRANYLGLGPYGHSLWQERRFGCGDWDNFLQYRLTTQYQQASLISAHEVREEKIFLGLRTAWGIQADLLLERQIQLRKLIDLGLLRMEQDKIMATLAGWMVLQRIILELV